VSTSPLRLVTDHERDVRIPETPAPLVIESEAHLRSLIASLSGVDAVGAEARAAKLATRSLKKSTKLAAIDLAISMVDLTTLEGADTPARVASLCTKAMRPDPRDSTVRVPGPGRARPLGAAWVVGQGRGRGDGVPVRTCFDGGEAARRQ
jgi:deoxyribose-phosphate aldolase